MGDGNWFKKLTAGGKDSKLGMLLLVIVAAVAVAVVMGPSGWGNIAPANQVQQAKEPAGTTDLAKFEKEYEAKIANTLQKIEGVGEVTVAVTLSSGPKSEFGVNQNQSKNTQEETPNTGGKRVQTQINDNTQMVLAGGQTTGNQPVKIVEHSPQVSGVLVVAEGAKDPYIKERVQKSVQTLLGIPASKIMVEPLSQGGK